MVFAADGIITKVINVGVSDKLINIITPEKGRIGVMVKGGRSPAGKYTSLTQLFTYGNFEISEKNGMYWLRGGSIIDPFYNLSSDISRVALAAYLCDLANEMTDEDGESEEIMRLLLNSLFLIGQDKKPQALIKSVFELRAAAISGYLPELSGCVYCDGEVPELTYLDVMGGRLVCSDCLAKRNAKKIPKSTDFDDLVETSILCGMSPSTLTALRYIVSVEANKMFSFALKGETELNELSRATETYILSHLGRSFDSLDFYKTVK